MEIKIQPASLFFGRQKVFMLNKNKIHEREKNDCKEFKKSTPKTF